MVILFHSSEKFDSIFRLTEVTSNVNPERFGALKKESVGDLLENWSCDC